VASAALGALIALGLAALVPVWAISAPLVFLRHSTPAHPQYQLTAASRSPYPPGQRTPVLGRLGDPLAPIRLGPFAWPDS